MYVKSNMHVLNECRLGVGVGVGMGMGVPVFLMSGNLAAGAGLGLAWPSKIFVQAQAQAQGPGEGIKLSDLLILNFRSTSRGERGSDTMPEGDHSWARGV